MTKTGDGTWTLGGSAAPANDATISVASGTLAFAAEDAAAGVALSFADGAALGAVCRADASAGYAGRGVVLTNGLNVAGAVLPVRLNAPGRAKDEAFDMAVFTAPEATVDALLPKLSGSVPGRGNAIVKFSASDAFELGGVAVKTVSAAVTAPGMLIIVR